MEEEKDKIVNGEVNDEGNKAGENKPEAEAPTTTQSEGSGATNEELEKVLEEALQSEDGDGEGRSDEGTSENAELTDTEEKAETLTAAEKVDDTENTQPTEDNESGIQNKETEQPQNVESVEKMVAQSQVNKLVGKAREEGRTAALKELLGKYGVSTGDELDEIFGKGQTYDSLNSELTARDNSIKEVMAENALLKTKIDPERWEDVKLIIGGKGLDISEDNILQFLATHPEWKGAAQNVSVDKIFTPDMGQKMASSSTGEIQKTQPSRLRKLGGEISEESEESETEKLDRLFGFRKN